MSNKKIAFSIIELMVVVLVIGILASVAVPAYYDYIVRSKVSEGLVVLDKIKKMSAEYYSSNGSFPLLTDLGITNGAQYATTNIASVSVAGVGSETQISVTFNTSVGAGVNASLNILSSSTNAPTTGVISWTCHSANILQRYLPSQCTNP